jgi:hypothetical protein
MDPVEVDFTEGLGPVDQVIPGYRWAADGRSIVISQGGKIRRLDVASGTVTTIPFTARVRRTATERVVAPRRISDGPVEVRFPRWHTVSPDGRTLAFQAVGRIWLMDLPSGTPRASISSRPGAQMDGAWSCPAARVHRPEGRDWAGATSGT